VDLFADHLKSPLQFQSWRRAASLCLAAMILVTCSSIAMGSDGAHGVDHDLSHANGSPNLEKMEAFRPDMALASLVVFLLLMGLLYAYAWKPISQALEDREASIRKSIDDAKAANETAQSQLAAYQTQLQQAAGETQQMLAQARADAESVKQRIVEEAKEEASRHRDRAVADIESAKKSALSELADQTTSMALQMARQVVGRELNANDHADLVRRSLDQFGQRN
jgi:F-type H+-transporting ATPase subunit b